MRIIGLMSGTSVDGIDAVLVDISGCPPHLEVDVIGHRSYPFDSEMRLAILRLMDAENARVPELTVLDFALGELYADAAKALCDAFDEDICTVDGIANHGQTMWHQPTNLQIGGVSSRGTLQIGSPGVLSARTGCSVISDFRSADMAVGGQGAPLVPFGDWVLFSHAMEARLALNIGGIANLTWLPASASLSDIVAFDTGPGNMLIDLAIADITNGEADYDAGGTRASSGIVSQPLLRELLSDVHFSPPPPKSAGRENFGSAYYVTNVRPLAVRFGVHGDDLLATLTQLTVESIAINIELHLPVSAQSCTIIVAGGGTRNGAIMNGLRQRLACATVSTCAEFGIPVAAREAICFALMGYETLNQRPSNVPAATGARKSVILGSVTRAMA